MDQALRKQWMMAQQDQQPHDGAVGEDDARGTREIPSRFRWPSLWPVSTARRRAEGVSGQTNPQMGGLPFPIDPN
jgi:hypothetical protein